MRSRPERRFNRDQSRAPLPSDVRAALAAIGPATWSELVRHLRPPRGRQSWQLRRLMQTLVNSGDVVRSRHGAYRLAAGEKIAGEVVLENGALHLLAGERSFALAGHVRLRVGDRVEALVEGDGVETVRVVTPSSDAIVCLLRGEFSPGRRQIADSLDPRVKGRIDLVAAPPGRAGDVVEVLLLAVSEKRAQGRVLRVIEAGAEASRAAEALLTAHRIPRVWPFDTDQLRVPKQVAARELTARRDLRQLPLVTIDGADARDFDDAVYAEPRRGGGWRLLVAIADVSHYVEAGSPLDHAARERGNSVYLPDRVVPMLPEVLSNEICSLVPHADRLAVACEMRISQQGRLSGYEFSNAVIRSHARLTYDQVHSFLASPASPAAVPDSPASVADDEPLAANVATSLRTLHDVFRALRRQRDERGALDFDAHEARIVLRQGRPVGVEPAHRNDAHRMIEEAMIVANVAAARFLERKRRGSEGCPPPVYRVHEPPAADQLDGLELALRTVGESLPTEPLTPQTLATICQRARRKSPWPAWIWDAIVLRTLTQANYQPRRHGHFGLALPAYVHFTSPIRRYADLLIHRQIKGEELPIDELEAIAAHVSMTERRAEQAERGVDAWLKCALVEQRIGDTICGTIAAVTAFGMFVELDGLFLQGLVHISKLGREYYDYAPESMALVARRSGARFALGDRVQVTVEDVSVAAGRIDLALHGVAPVRRGRRR